MVGGLFTDGSGALFIYEAASLAAAEELVADDPYRVGGAFASYTLSPWEIIKANPALPLRSPVSHAVRQGASMKDADEELTWEVITSDPLQTCGDDPPPGQRHRIWPPISSTLVAGRNSAVLVDAPITTAQAASLCCQSAECYPR